MEGRSKQHLNVRKLVPKYSPLTFLHGVKPGVKLHIDQRVEMWFPLFKNSVMLEVLTCWSSVASYLCRHSFVEVLPLVICEAMAFERPVVCSRIDAIPEVQRWQSTI